ncbi:hypothetical protein [Streptomyces sp. CoH27]|uniref:hypothetical protein n=1 Tax=Streptomyces sp. CoH27 TaxID=2875763 RepID=UPI001CD6E9C6|nr:hypothetical protein [Streptomyces sp. CoH27]
MALVVAGDPARRDEHLAAGTTAQPVVVIAVRFLHSEGKGPGRRSGQQLDPSVRVVRAHSV